MRSHLCLEVNGFPWEGDVEVGQTLLDLLRDSMGLTGAKKGCDGGECGACVVLLNGKPVNSCLILGVDLDGDSITTVEGLNDEESRIIQEGICFDRSSSVRFLLPRDDCRHERPVGSKSPPECDRSQYRPGGPFMPVHRLRSDGGCRAGGGPPPW